MPLIVDTYNVLHVTGVLPPAVAGVDVDGLASLIAASRYGGDTTWLVCDGPRPSGSRRPSGASGSGAARRRSDARDEGPSQPAAASAGGRIVVHYVGPGRDADGHIGRMIDASTHPKRLMVVSSDRRVQRMARRRRCRTMTADGFLTALLLDVHRPGGSSSHLQHGRGRPPVPLDRQQVDRWVAAFGVEEAWMKIPVALRGTREGDPLTSATAPHAAQIRSDRDDPASSDVSQAEPEARHGDGSPPRRHQSEAPRTGTPRRALEGISSLDEIDPSELDRFDMNDWLPPPHSHPKVNQRRPPRSEP